MFHFFSRFAFIEISNMKIAQALSKLKAFINVYVCMYTQLIIIESSDDNDIDKKAITPAATAARNE